MYIFMKWRNRDRGSSFVALSVPFNVYKHSQNSMGHILTDIYSCACIHMLVQFCARGSSFIARSVHCNVYMSRTRFYDAHYFMMC